MYQNAASYNEHLTEYAQSFANERESKLSEILFPKVFVNNASGTFDIRGIKDAFRLYQMIRARRAPSTEIEINVTKGAYDCTPQGLKVGTWRQDISSTPEGEIFREENVNALLDIIYTNRAFEAASIFKKSISPAAGVGIGWANGEGTPIEEIDSLMKMIKIATGKRPNHMVLGFEAWSILKNHPEIVGRIHSLDVTATIDAIKRMFVYQDIEITIDDTVYNPGPLGAEGDNEFVLNKDILLMYSSPTPSRSDVSCGKEFTQTPEGPEITSKEEELDGTIHDQANWSSDRQITCPAAGTRIELTAA